MNSASLCSLAGRYDNPIPPRFIAPINFLKIPALAGRYDNPISTWFLAPIDCLKIATQGTLSLNSHKVIMYLDFLTTSFLYILWWHWLKKSTDHFFDWKSGHIVPFLPLCQLLTTLLKWYGVIYNIAAIARIILCRQTFRIFLKFFFRCYFWVFSFFSLPNVSQSW